jgi:hypothetical protein
MLRIFRQRHVFFGQFHLKKEAVERSTAVPEFRTPHHNELELSGNQHQQDGRQCVHWDPKSSSNLVRVSLQRAQCERLEILSPIFDHAERRHQRQFSLSILISVGRSSLPLTRRCLNSW